MPRNNTPKQIPQTSFEPFSWLPEEARSGDSRVLMAAKDISAGIALTLELLERSRLDEDDAYLNAYQRGVLERLAISSCHLLHDTIDRRLDSIRQNASKEES